MEEQERRKMYDDKLKNKMRERGMGKKGAMKICVLKGKNIRKGE